MRPFTFLFSILALTGLALGASAPESDLENRSVEECGPVYVIISIFSQIQAPATSFCSSFLSIPVKTITSGTTTTSRPKPVTVTSTVTITPRVSVTATTSTTLAHAKRAITPAIDQRNNDISLPSYLSGFASTAISTACSCLSIVASTTTVKTTYTVVGSASTVVVQKTLTAAPVTTTVSTVTIKVTASSTVSTSSTRPFCANALPTFIVQLGKQSTFEGTQLQGTYDQLDELENISFDGLTNRSAAVAFSLTADGALIVPSFSLVAIANIAEERLQPIDLTTYPIPDTAVIPVCSVATGVLTCIFTSTGGNVNSVLQLCPGQYGDQNVLWIWTSLGPGCVDGGFDVVPLCTPPAA